MELLGRNAVDEHCLPAAIADDAHDPSPQPFSDEMPVLFIHLSGGAVGHGDVVAVVFRMDSVPAKYVLASPGENCRDIPVMRLRDSSPPGFLQI